jgi:hypothetical protein
LLPRDNGRRTSAVTFSPAVSDDLQIIMKRSSVASRNAEPEETVAQTTIRQINRHPS